MDEGRYRELKEKMAALKSLYASRHYSQCAKFGELLLSESHDQVCKLDYTSNVRAFHPNKDQTHPLHLAHLNFYTALSHDTLAREATLKNRWKELSLADQHYTAAIHALSPLSSPTQEEPWSPASSLPSPYSRRRSSVYSHASAASSATSIDEDDYLHSSPASKPTYHAHGLPSTQEAQLRTSTSRPQTPQQIYFTANIASFVRLLEAHRADVRVQKDKAGVPAVRFVMPEPRTSPVRTRWSRGAGGEEVVDEAEEDALERIREMRKNVRFRPRFDPESVRRLCGEAMAELTV
ncbi:hypothetical protein E8E13_007724 [Curvularia kusanoi]|uniref:Uncharacterized protein n=1 Tax=Curvularia kusanoi TaxID=90978 RepID=A0A9P4TEX7_CURKU|nr:hypothetical protein E8E13_007724 [Curvularia kusanoi]